MGIRAGWGRLALALALLTGLCGLATPVARTVVVHSETPSASTTPFDTPDLTLSDLLHARPVAAAADQPVSALPAVLFMLAALVFLGLYGPLPVRAAVFRAAVPRLGRAPPVAPN